MVQVDVPEVAREENSKSVGGGDSDAVLSSHGARKQKYRQASRFHYATRRSTRRSRCQGIDRIVQQGKIPVRDSLIVLAQLGLLALVLRPFQIAKRHLSPAGAARLRRLRDACLFAALEETCSIIFRTAERSSGQSETTR